VALAGAARVALAERPKSAPDLVQHTFFSKKGRSRLRGRPSLTRTRGRQDVYTPKRVEGLFRGIGLALFGIGLTWLPTVVLGRIVSRRGFVFWVWDRSGAIGRILIAVGFGMALLGLGQGTGSGTGSSLLVIGALLGMAGIWLILPGP